MSEPQSASALGQVRVALTVSDPWDFVTENGSGPFTGMVVRAGTAEASSGGYELVIRLDQPVKNQAREWSYFVARPAHSGVGLSSVKTGLRTACALTSLTEEQANHSTPFTAIDYARSLKVLADLAVL